MAFPIGYHSLHPNVSMNFQMNRWFGWVGEPDMLEEMRMAAPPKRGRYRMSTVATYYEVMTHLESM